MPVRFRSVSFPIRADPLLSRTRDAIRVKFGSSEDEEVSCTAGSSRILRFSANPVSTEKTLKYSVSILF